MATKTDATAYKAIIDAAEKRLEKELKSREAARDRGEPEDEGEFSSYERARQSIARHRSFLQFVAAGLLPASIAVRMAVEGRSALDECDDD